MEQGLGPTYGSIDLRTACGSKREPGKVSGIFDGNVDLTRFKSQELRVRQSDVPCGTPFSYHRNLSTVGGFITVPVNPPSMHLSWDGSFIAPYLVRAVPQKKSHDDVGPSCHRLALPCDSH